MKLLLIGGHMAPALGFLSAVPHGTDVVYVGRQHVFEADEGESLEQKTIRERGLRFIAFRSGRVQRRLSRQTIPSLLKIPKGFVQALQILKKEKPDIVIGFGGYLSVPLGIAAKMLGIPLLIHESTLRAGLANKVLAAFADCICISWESSRPYFPQKKITLTGNPLLPFVSSRTHLPLPESKEKLPLIMVTGGSGGSHVVNAIILQILPELLEKAKVVHQTGDAHAFGDYKKLLAKKKMLPRKLQQRYSVVQFIHPEIINTVFAKADLVIGRSGINTVASLLVLRKKAILIPLLVGQKNEQLNNAKLMESEGLATILDQKSLSAKILFTTIQDMLSHKTIETAKWQIPVITHGAEHMMKEVLRCVSSHNGK